MKTGLGGFGIQYEHGVDFYNLDISGFEDIGSALKFSPKTALNLLVLPENLQADIQQQRSNNTQVSYNDRNQLKISLRTILDTLGIVDYKIIIDNNFRSIEKSKRSGVIYIGRMNDFGDFNISPINGHINQWKRGYMNQDSFGGRNSGEYVLFYNKKVPPTTLERINQLLIGLTGNSKRLLLPN